MINIYQQPTEKNPTLGYTFPIYSQDKICVHDQKYPNVATAMAAFDMHKAWIVNSVFEDLRLYFEKIVPKNSRMVQVQEACNALESASKDMLVYKESLDYCLNKVQENINFMRILVRNTPEDFQVPIKMMAATLTQFTREQINERQKDQNENQSTNS